jgi:uncharacterized membrane protein
MQPNFKKVGRLLVKSFVKGLIFFIPMVLSIYLVFKGVIWIDSLIPIKIPGLGLLTLLAITTLIGYLAKSFLLRPTFELIESYFEKIPLFSIIFTSFKEVLEAFVGDDKKFTEPVIVALNESESIFKMGFITKHDLECEGMNHLCSVYLPHSYNFSGNQFLVKRSNVHVIKGDPALVMKFIVSGGVSEIEGQLSINEKAETVEYKHTVGE